MVNWKTYRIIKLERKTSCSSGEKFVDLHLDGSVEFESSGSSEISFFSRHLRDSLQAGDYVEIDLDYTRTMSFNEVLGNTNAIRKLSSSAVVSSSSSEITRGQSIADRLIREVNSQPPGKVEFEHRIEHRDRSPERFIYRRNY